MTVVYDEFAFGDQPLGEMLDCNNECRHGRLPYDPSKPCGCWRQEVAVVVELPGLPSVEEQAA